MNICDPNHSVTGGLQDLALVGEFRVHSDI